MVFCCKGGVFNDQLARDVARNRRAGGGLHTRPHQEYASVDRELTDERKVLVGENVFDGTTLSLEALFLKQTSNGVVITTAICLAVIYLLFKKLKNFLRFFKEILVASYITLYPTLKYESILS